VRWRYFEKTGCLLTADGSRDEFVLPQGFDSYSFPRPRFNTTGSLSRSIETAIFTSKQFSNTTVDEPTIPDSDLENSDQFYTDSGTESEGELEGGD
jgi:hypothetical protein